MRDDYKREQQDFFQMMQDLQDETDQREQKQQQERLRVLAAGLQTSLESLAIFKRQGFDIVRMPEEILRVWKHCLPEVWSVPEAKPLINLLFPNNIS
jgi:hypothetical protein